MTSLLEIGQGVECFRGNPAGCGTARKDGQDVAVRVNRVVTSTLLIGVLLFYATTVLSAYGV